MRSATARDHADIDARFAPLAEGGEAAYREFLRLSAAAIGPLEQALREADVERILPDWEDRARWASLRADLVELGITIPRAARPPRLGGEAHQFGVLYVLEGSRLGAKVLIRRLLGHPGLPTSGALRYLRHGEGLPLWHTFMQCLESSDAVRCSPAEAVAGARVTFAWFGANAAAA